MIMRHMQLLIVANLDRNSERDDPTSGLAKARQEEEEEGAEKNRWHSQQVVGLIG